MKANGVTDGGKWSDARHDYFNLLKPTGYMMHQQV